MEDINNIFAFNYVKGERTVRSEARERKNGLVEVGGREGETEKQVHGEGNKAEEGRRCRSG